MAARHRAQDMCAPHPDHGRKPELELKICELHIPTMAASQSSSSRYVSSTSRPWLRASSSSSGHGGHELQIPTTTKVMAPARVKAKAKGLSARSLFGFFFLSLVQLPSPPPARLECPRTSLLLKPPPSVGLPPLLSSGPAEIHFRLRPPLDL
ncbi:hypothetical protein NL676_017628 [Syzygium grande]|nr:hypothetical protein NL676_017628 [Syzygium grande]